MPTLDGKPVSYCFLRDNPKLRRMIEFQARQKGLTQTCKEAEVDYRNFNKFIRGETKEISQHNLLKICNVLKIRINLDFEIDDTL